MNIYTRMISDASKGDSKEVMNILNNGNKSDIRNYVNINIGKFFDSAQIKYLHKTLSLLYHMVMKFDFNFIKKNDFSYIVADITNGLMNAPPDTNTERVIDAIEDFQFIMSILVVKSYDQPGFNNFFDENRMIDTMFNKWQDAMSIEEARKLSDGDFNKVFGSMNFSSKYKNTWHDLPVLAVLVMLYGNEKTLINVFKHIPEKPELCEIFIEFLEDKAADYHGRLLTPKEFSVYLDLGIKYGCLNFKKAKEYEIQKEYLRNKFKNSANKMRALNVFNEIFTELKYRPGGTGYHEALISFQDALKNTSTFPNDKIKETIKFIDNKAKSNGEKPITTKNNGKTSGGASSSKDNGKNNEKKCPPHQVLNPKTNRCVNKTGTVGKKLVTKECPPHQILNPATNRCVNRDGAIGRQLMKK